MTRRQLIETKLDEKQKVDFEEIEADDQIAIKKMITDEEAVIHGLKKSIKKFRQDPELTLGPDFVALVSDLEHAEKRVILIQKVKEHYV